MTEANPLPFVARESEIRQLGGFLSRALSGQGMVCFVSGDAGSGKTALVTEFARRALEEHEDLVVASGQSDAQTGEGDAYLPFRELLSTLTGNVDEELAQSGAMRENASRLKQLLGYSARAVVEIGPDLIGIFVPGAGIATQVAAFAAEKAGWLDKLDRLNRRNREGALEGREGIDQDNIFEQYTNVLLALAAEKPLLLILDDMQWADAASVSLLFRLSRRIGGGRILIVATYRPDEVALGRKGERHPLEKVLAEIKRYHGDIRVVLGQDEETDGRLFVDSLLDTEPNRLGEGFRAALYHRTAGHPLFTIELLRAMQERGDLVRDPEAMWAEGPVLDWGTLPARVEGVIEERIGRLEVDLRETLTVACVEGERFTAEVVARIQALDARTLVRRLGSEMDKRHRLVGAVGIQRLGQHGVSPRRLSLYRFQHNLFQAYLYNGLGEAELAYLHEDVGSVLEELYGDQAGEIAVQLAWHFEEAGIEEKAAGYLRQAGEQAAARYANDEALTYLSRALDMAPPDDPVARVGLLLARERVYGLVGRRAEQRQDLDDLADLAEALDDDDVRGQLALRQATYAEVTADYAGAVNAARKAIQLAQSAGDDKAEALGHLTWGHALWRQGEYQASRSRLEQALGAAQEARWPRVEADCLRNLGTVSYFLRDYDEARSKWQEALAMYNRVDERWGESAALNNLGGISLASGDYTAARDFYERSLRVKREIGDRKGERSVLGNLGVIAVNQADYVEARAWYAQALEIASEVDDPQGEAMQLTNLGSVCEGQGDYTASRRYSERALEIQREIGDRQGVGVTLGNLGLAFHGLGDYARAWDCYEQSLAVARELGDRRGESLVLMNLGNIRRSMGQYAEAMALSDDALALCRDTGDRQIEGEVLGYRSLLSCLQGMDQKALGEAQTSLEIARELGDRNTEGHALSALGRVLACLGRYDEATGAHKDALAVRHALGQEHLVVVDLGGLALAALEQGRLVVAGECAREILPQLRARALDGVDEPLMIYKTCYDVLRAGDDPRAAEVLQAAHDFVEERAHKIEDVGMREAYRENAASQLSAADSHNAASM